VVNVGPHLVGLIDADLAKLNGAELAGGVLSSLNGIELQTGKSISGRGTVNGNVRNVFGVFMGTPETEGLELTGVVTGSGVYFNTVITGLDRPGLSGGFNVVGGSQTIDVEIGIEGPKSGYFDIPAEEVPGSDDQIIPGEFDQYYVFGSFPGLPQTYTFNGTMKVTLDEGYTPSVAEFLVIQTGEYELMEGMVFGPGELEFGPNFKLMLPELPAGFDWDVDQVEGTAGHLILSIVPEPGTLLLLASSGLCLLLYAWRIRRW
jgi:hypothetical protein